MEHEGKNEALLRKYLLGELDEAQEQSFEEQLLADEELSELLLAEEEDLVDDYLRGDLSEGERERFESYFLVTADRRKKLKFGEALSRYPPVQDPVHNPNPATNPKPTPDPNPVVELLPWWKRAFSTPYPRLAAATLLILAIGLVVWLILQPRPEVSKGMLALREAYPDQRPTEARITEWKYAPPPPTIRGSGGNKFDYVALDRAKALIQLEASEHPRAQSYHDLGRLYLAQGDFGKAIDQFDNALKLDEKNAQLHTDYGAALTEIGKAHTLNGEAAESFEAFAQGIEYLNKALELNESLVDALFNRALLYEYMGLPQAEDDWKRYLEKDPNSEWANEARRHLRDLEEKKKTRSQNNADLLPEFIKAYQSKDDRRSRELISKNTETITGRLAWWQLAGGYLDRLSKADKENATMYLKALAYAGELQEQKAGDRFISDLARFYGSSTSGLQESVVQAHALVDQAHALLARSETDNALGLYESAREAFNKAGDELESRFVDYYIGYSFYRKSQFNKSLLALTQVADYGKARRYLWLAQVALTMIANIHAESDQFSTSLARYGESLEISKQINDEYNIQRNLTSLASVQKSLGDRRESLAYIQRCLERANNNWPGTRQMYRNFDTAAGISNAFGYYAAAGEYERAALQQALEAKDPAFEYLSYMHLGSIYAKLQDHTQALRCAEQSYQVARTMSDERTSRRPIAHSLLQLAHVYRQASDYDNAVVHYDDAINIYQNIGLYAYLYEAHKGRLLCYIAQGNDSLAEEELQTVLNFFEEHRSKIREEKNRNSFFDLEQYVYDIAIDFEHSRKHDMKAFEYSETSRARSLHDLIAGHGEVVGKDRRAAIIQSEQQSLDPDTIQGKTPARTQILQYSVLDDKLLIWLVSNTEFEVRETRVASSALTEKVLKYWQTISNPPGNKIEESRRLAMDLYDILIKPVEGLLEKDKQIIIVPDKALNYLPFNSLISSSTDDYLIRQYVLSVAPSTNTFQSSSDEARKRSGARNERVLSVGDPRFNRNVFQGLSGLPSSKEEAESVFRCYRAGLCLTGENARKTRILSEMVKSDVIHIASHYVIDKHDPMLSKLLLADEPRGDSTAKPSDAVLQAYDIYERKLPVARLVVLSACQTGIEQYYKGEGMIGMSRTFLAASVPLVVASLWPVDSEPTTDLMISLHKHRRRGDGLSSAAALRQAQLDMIDNAERYSQPYYWAAFIIIGGYADF